MLSTVEFSEDFSQRYSGNAALLQKAYYRLAVRAGEIPYFDGGLNIDEFSTNDISGAVKDVLADFKVSVSVSEGRVFVGDIELDVPGGLT